MVSSTRVQPDPVLPSEEVGAVDDDFASHVRTYNRFLSVAKWFIFHLVVLMIALYFGVIRGDAITAFVLVALAIAIMVGGFLSHRPIREDLAAGPDTDREEPKHSRG
jgi:hypothetical protein